MLDWLLLSLSLSLSFYLSRISKYILNVYKKSTNLGNLKNKAIHFLWKKLSQIWKLRNFIFYINCNLLISWEKFPTCIRVNNLIALRWKESGGGFVNATLSKVQRLLHLLYYTNARYLNPLTITETDVELRWHACRCERYPFNNSVRVRSTAPSRKGWLLGLPILLTLILIEVLAGGRIPVPLIARLTARVCMIDVFEEAEN